MRYILATALVSSSLSLAACTAADYGCAADLECGEGRICSATECIPQPTSNPPEATMLPIPSSETDDVLGTVNESPTGSGNAKDSPNSSTPVKPDKVTTPDPAECAFEIVEGPGVQSYSCAGNSVDARVTDIGSMQLLVKSGWPENVQLTVRSWRLEGFDVAWLEPESSYGDELCVPELRACESPDGHATLDMASPGTANAGDDDALDRVEWTYSLSLNTGDVRAKGLAVHWVDAYR